MTNAPTPAAPTAATKPRTRVNWTPAERSEWLALFEKSGQNVTEFCRTNDLPPATLSLWRSQQKGDAGGADDGDGGGLVEVPAAALIGARTTAAVKMALPSGVRLEVPTGTDPTWVSVLVKSLMSAGA
jgi:transposase-like protein